MKSTSPHARWASAATAEMPAKRLMGSLLSALFGASCCPEERDLDFVEVFAGEQSISKGLRLLGMRGLSMDGRISVDHDVLTPVGFLALLRGVMRLRPGGLLWAAPPCSTWIFLSRHSTMRHVDVAGNPDSFYVRSQNALVCRLLVLCALCIKRGVFWVIEQPVSTIMFEYAPFKRFLQRHAPLIKTARLHMGAFGLLAEKQTVLLGTAPHVEQLTRAMSTTDKHDLRERADAVRTVHTKFDVVGRRRVQGTRDLKSTQAYPLQFGAAHALAFQSCSTASSSGAAAAATAPAASAPAATAGPAATAAAATGPPTTAPAALAAPAFELDSDSEHEGDDGPWYMADFCPWRPDYWHDNSRAEAQLPLSKRARGRGEADP